MPFDAGSITGKLELDIDSGAGFRTSMLQAEGLAKLFPDTVTAFLANPLLGAAEAAKEFGTETLRAFNEVLGDAQAMQLDADKLGVNTEWLSQWAGVAKTVDVDLAGLTSGILRFNARIGDAIGGTKDAVEGFAKLGITQQWLNQHAGDTAAIFDEVEKRLAAISDSSVRAADAKDVLGRGFTELIPIFTKSADEIQHLIDVQKKLGDTTDEAEGKSALAIKNLQVEWQEAMDGIQKAAAKPVMSYIADHHQEIEDDIVKLSTTIRTEMDKVTSYFDSSEGKQIVGDFKTAIREIGSELPSVDDVLHRIVIDLDAIAKAFNNVTGEAGKFKDYLAGEGGGDQQRSRVTREQIESGDVSDDYDSLDEEKAAYLRQHGFKVPAGVRAYRAWARANPDAEANMLRQAEAADGPETPAPAPATSSIPPVRDYRGTASYLDQRGFKDDLGNPVDEGWVRRHQHDAQRMLDQAAKTAATPQIIVNVQANFPNLNPFEIGKKVVDAIKSKAAQMASAANVQSSIGGG